MDGWDECERTIGFQLGFHNDANNRLLWGGYMMAHAQQQARSAHVCVSPCRLHSI